MAGDVKEARKWPPESGFYALLRGEDIVVNYMNGDEPTRGKLVGYSKYEILLEVSGGRQVLIEKHAIKCTEPSRPISLSPTQPIIPSAVKPIEREPPRKRKQVITF